MNCLNCNTPAAYDSDSGHFTCACGGLTTDPDHEPKG